MDLDIDDEKSLRCFTPGGGAVKTLAATPLQLAHNLINNTDSGVHSQQSLKSVKIEILQPEVKGGLILEGILVSVKGKDEILVSKISLKCNEKKLKEFLPKRNKGTCLILPFFDQKFLQFFNCSFEKF